MDALDHLIYLLGFFLGLLIFALIRSLSNVSLGCIGNVFVLIGCWIAGVFLVLILGAIAKWVIIILAVWWVWSKLFGGKGNDNGNTTQ